MTILRKGFIALSFVLCLAGQAQAASYTRLLQCDTPSDPRFKSVGSLVVQRPEDPRHYREPIIVFNYKDGTQQTFRVRGASWLYSPNPLVESNVVITDFAADNVVLGQNPASITFEMRSNGSFQPLSGLIKFTSSTFQTCGDQSTSAYYWTRSSMTRNEAFACPGLGKPPGCPGVGPN